MLLNALNEETYFSTVKCIPNRKLLRREPTFTRELRSRKNGSRFFKDSEDILKPFGFSSRFSWNSWGKMISWSNMKHSAKYKLCRAGSALYNTIQYIQVASHVVSTVEATLYIRPIEPSNYRRRNIKDLEETSLCGGHNLPPD